MTRLKLTTYLQAFGSGQRSFSSAENRTQENELQLQREEFRLQIAHWQCKAEAALRNTVFGLLGIS